MPITINGSGTITGASTLATATTLTTPTISGNANMTSGTKYQVGGVATNALAWVNFAGASGTRNLSYNVSSVTYGATGNYTVNFANTLSDANYAISVNSSTNAGNGYLIATVNDANIGSAPTTSAFNFSTRVVSSGANTNPTYVYAMVFGN